MAEKIFSHEFFLPASEVNAYREMPLPRLVTTIIDVATSHANRLGIGFDRMISRGISWVLSRLTIDIIEMPSVGRTYRMDTWVESVSRLFSERDFEMTDTASGRTVVRAHSTWMAIDMASRRPGDLTPVFDGLDVISDRRFDGHKGSKLTPSDTPGPAHEYTFTVSDIDVNRHVTTKRYIDLIIDMWTLDHYEDKTISLFEIAFKHEARYGQHARIVRSDHEDNPDIADVRIDVGPTLCCVSRIHFSERSKAQDS